MADWHLDDSYHIDWDTGRDISGEVLFSETSSYIHHLFQDQEIEAKVEFKLSLFAAVGLDLLRLVPEKFRNSQILIDYVYEAGLQVGAWLSLVRDIIKLESPYTVGSMEYLRYLGTLIGVTFPPEDETSELEMRKTLAQAIDWYKLKGTYKALQIIALIYQFTVNLYDMYTNDYTTFYMVDWFVGEEDENPPGFDVTYYKSPHFGLEILLNKTYEEDSLLYLWKTDYADNFMLQVEDNRPVHTVPHYLINLNPKTDEFGNIIETDGSILTKVLENWEYSIKFFDMTESSDAWNFDDGTHFDQSAEAFIKSITKWVLGTGNYPCTLSGSVDVETPVLTGTIDTDDITISDDKITFEFIVPKATVQSNISELGLYIPGTPDKLVLLSCFPRINKSSNVELRVVVEVYRSDLS
jgi:hypothetical protein